MNPYFQESNERFRRALELLRERGFEASKDVIMDALFYDLYRLEMHEALAFYHASVKNLDSFLYHFLLCRRLDLSVAERVLASDVVVSAFGAELLVQIASSEEKYVVEPRRRFKVIDPAGEKMMLRFKPSHEKEIEKIYQSLKATTRRYFDRHGEPDFNQVNFLILDYGSDRVYSDASTGDLLFAFRLLAPHIEDVRFLMYGEQESSVDEVVIQNGSVYYYRHDLDDDYTETRLEHFGAIAMRYHDVPLQHWVTAEYRKL